MVLELFNQKGENMTAFVELTNEEMLVSDGEGNVGTAIGGLVTGAVTGAEAGAKLGAVVGGPAGAAIGAIIGGIIVGGAGLLYGL
jgi:hypothetical protein